MFNTLFASVTEGRLSRLKFLGCCLLLTLIAAFFLVGLSVALEIGDRVISTRFEEHQDKLLSKLGFPLALLLVVAFALQVYVQANVITKRLRDIGLPGWPLLLIVLVIEATVWGMFSGAIAGISHLTFLGLLLVIPGNCIARRKRSHFGNRNF